MDEHQEHERLVTSLLNQNALTAYKSPLDSYRPGLVPRLLGFILVLCGTILYGSRPSYEKFRAIEVIARMPYHSWESALFTLLTLGYKNEARALQLAKHIRFAHLAAENETMHVVVISQLAKAHGRGGIIRYTLIPILSSFIYFWASYLLYLVHSRWSLELNYVFEQHAFDQYSEFLNLHATELKRCPIDSEFLRWYGRVARTEYDFFESVCIDELIHRNRSISEIALQKKY